MRRIRLIKNAKPTLEGAGVHLVRAFGFGDERLFDPFLLLDDFRNDDTRNYLAGFPWHPHRGMETITYMLEGSAEHSDSLGNSGVIRKGDVQWMTAGRGIIHQEMPKPNEIGRMYGFQLWANLPAAKKMMPPRYQDILAEDIPKVELPNGAEVKIICGSFQGVRGPAQDIMIEPQYWDVYLPADVELSLPAPMGETCFFYAYAGEVEVSGQTVRNRQVALLENGDGVTFKTSSEEFRMLFLRGKPLNESISWRGPIVMNTREETATAFKELEKGTFLK
ncbi:MAG: pirin family protein [Candidatus Cloacimonetes bacterium]|nr:pirin family protein [Candidatus Cloacimonadota bacterium]